MDATCYDELMNRVVHNLYHTQFVTQHVLVCHVCVLCTCHVLMCTCGTYIFI